MFDSKVLKIAGVYNLVWGAFIILWPQAIFEFANLEQPRYLGLWQCIGMIVGVYGLGYLIASFDYKTHWPIVLVGFLGKIFGPIGFIWSLAQGQFNLAFGTVIIFNDLIWWIPFAWLLADALKAHATTPDQIQQIDWKTLQMTDGRSLIDASFDSQYIFVLVRHEGCTFCRKSISLLSKHLTKIVNKDLKPVLVHMGTSENSESLRKTYGLQDIMIVSDPERLFYQAMSLSRGSWWQLFGPKIWWRGFIAGVIMGHGVGKLAGDGFQLGGVFHIFEGNLSPLHIPKDASDVENWDQILSNVMLQY